jgi:methane monooxygenase component A beta chain/propane monooxygenase small subunit
VAGSFASPRDLTYIQPQGRRLTEYEVVICNTQPDLGQFDTGGWFLRRPNGLGTHDARTTKLAHPNWFDYRDPSGLWQRPYIAAQAQHERSIQNAVGAAKLDGALRDIAPGWLSLLARYYEALACFEWGMFLAHAFVTREALSDTLTMAVTFSGMDRLRHQQDIALFSLDLDEQLADYEGGLGVDVWMNDPVCQPARRLAERLLALRDWGEMVLMTNLIVDPLYTAVVGSEFFRRLAPRHGDVITPVIEMTAESDRLRNRKAAMALVQLVSQDADRQGRPVPAAQNLQVIQGWVDSWCEDTLAAVDGFLPLFDLAPDWAGSGRDARTQALASTRSILENAGLQVPAEVSA